MMELLSRLFKGKRDQRGARESVSDYDTLVELYKCDDDTRMRKIIYWCEKVDNTKLNVVQYAILHDSDLGVKMAGLKRIHLFTDKLAVREFLKDEMTFNVGRKCEPYYSMALSKMGLISYDEFQRRVNGQLVN